MGVFRVRFFTSLAHLSRTRCAEQGRRFLIQYQHQIRLAMASVSAVPAGKNEMIACHCGHS